MNKIKFLVLISFFLFQSRFLKAQVGNIPINSWRYHTSFYNAKVVVQAENRMYCGTEGGLFYFDKDDNSVNKFSKLDGLNELEINALYYHNATKSLIIGYKTGNIDVLRDNTVYNVPYIFTASNITGSKVINAIGSYKNTALIACDFGVVLLNLDKFEIKESWLNIAENGSALSANDIQTIGDSVFIASNKGLYGSKFDSRNMMDYRSWQKQTIVSSSPNLAVSKLATFGQSLVASVNGQGVYIKSSQWENRFKTNQSIKALAGNSNEVWFFTNNRLGKISSDTSTWQVSEVSQANDIAIDKDGQGKVWLSDGNIGLVRFSESDQSTQKYVPNGPINNLVFNLKYVNGYVFNFSGGYNDDTNPKFRDAAYSFFKDGEWFSNRWVGEISLRDFNSIAFDNSNGNYYFASGSSGLVEKNNDNYITYDGNSNTCPIYTNFGTRVLDVIYDNANDNLWFSNWAPVASSAIQKFKKGSCIGYNFPIYSILFPAQILTDNASNIWLRLLPREGNLGVIVFNDAKIGADGVPSFKNLVKGVGIGNLSDNVVKCMVKDRNGDIWLGTNNGVSVVFNPGNVADGGISDATIPIYENRPLLFDQIVTCMDVDGGNRKWMGTNNGIYLFNPEGNRVIHYFNTENSPLLSNVIISIAVNQVTGEVFIGTDRGLVSFRESATTGNDDSPEVIVFPNPVKANYTGTIGFTGLATDAVVKITDINGRLLYETKANGGAAQWNARDYNGKKIEPGVYVVMTSKSDGTSPAVGKLFVTD